MTGCELLRCRGQEGLQPAQSGAGAVLHGAADNQGAAEESAGYAAEYLATLTRQELVAAAAELQQFAELI